jgi:hypothetical protein
MPNTLLTPTEIAMEALVLVQSNMVASRLMDRSYEGEIRDGKVGESIQIRRRQSGTANEWTPGGGLTINTRKETPITISLEKHFDSSVEVTQRERQFTIRQFSSQILAPEMLAISEAIDAYACSKLRDLPETVGASVTAPLAALPDSSADLAAVRRVLNDLKVPMNPRYQLVSPAYEEALLSAGEFTKVNESGASGALREAELGRLLGFSTFMDQNVDDTEHTSGTMSTAAVDGSGSPVAAGSTVIPYDTGDQAAGTFTAGDIVHIAGYGKVVVDALETASSNAGSITIREPLREDVADTSVMTVFDGNGGTYESHGAAFHPRAFAMIAPALRPHENAPESTTVVDPNTGLSLRVTFDYDRVAKADVMSIDCLVGVKMVDGNLGAQITLGTD